MTQFDLSVWLLDQSRKIITRDGRPVKIVCWDLPGEYKILAIIDEKPDGSYTVLNKKCDGTGEVKYSDLFFADKEEETIDDTEMNSLAYLTELGYTCIPPKKEEEL